MKWVPSVGLGLALITRSLFGVDPVGSVMILRKRWVTVFLEQPCTRTPHIDFLFFLLRPPPGSWVDWQQHSSQCKPPGGIDLGYAIQKTMPSRRPTILKGWMIFFSDEQQKKHYSVVNDLLSGRLCSIFYEQVGATCSARGDFILPVVSETHRLHYVCKKMSGNSQFFRVIPRAKNKSDVFEDMWTY